MPNPTRIVTLKMACVVPFRNPGGVVIGGDERASYPIPGGQLSLRLREG
jgi:hypothetical protein